MTEAARPLTVRKQDTLRRLEEDVDAWIATAATDGTPYLMPLSFLWDGRSLLLSTAVNNPTARNLRDNGLLQLTLGLTRDVVHITATAETVLSSELTTKEGDAFAGKGRLRSASAGELHLLPRDAGEDPGVA